MPKPSTWPTEAEAYRLATDLISGVATAPGEIFSAFLDPITQFLTQRFRFADSQQHETAAADAIIAVVQSPNRYDPNKLPFAKFLRMVASRKMMNLVAKEARHRKKISLASVAEPADYRNHSPNDNALSWEDPRLVAEMTAFNPTESAVLEMMRRGYRNTADFSTIPELAGVEPNELAKLVKRWKDRIKARLKRAVGGAK